MKALKIAFAIAFAVLASGCCKSSETYIGQLTDPLDQECWKQSDWISAADAPVITEKVTGKVFRAADGASWFISNVTNKGKVTSAKWMTSGLGIYDIYVNGKLIGAEVLKPGFTHYAKTKYAFTYDVTEALKCGKGATNVFAAQVTPGWWGDKIVTPGGHQGMIGKKCAFRGVLELTFEDGSKDVLGTDTESWKAGIAGPVKHAAIFDGEEYDAREPQGYLCYDKLGTPEINEEFPGEVFPTAGAEVYFREDLALSPAVAYSWKDIEGADDDNFGKIIKISEFAAGQTIVLKAGEHLVIDFGQNCSGVPRFVFKAAEGTQLLCLPGEILNDGNGAKSRGMDGPEGSVHRTNLRKADIAFRVNYTFGKSGKFVTYNPRRTFFGYRFIDVTADNTVTFKSIKSIPVTSITSEIGKIETGVEDVNKLISNTMWGQRSNYLSVPTDCPQRDERLGWTADTQVFTEAGTFFANTDRFFHKWMRDMRNTQNEFGAFPGVAPLAQYGAIPDDYMRLGWCDAGIIVPWTVWKQFGDNSLVDENWEAMERYMNHLAETEYRHENIAAENGNYQYADWLSYEPLETNSRKAFYKDANGKRQPLPESIVLWNLLCSSYWAMDAGMMRDMAAATGRDTAKYEAMAQKAKDRIKTEFLNADGTFKLDILNTMQTPALFVLKNHVLEGEAKDAMLARLRQNFEDHDGCLQTGFLGTSILMDVLSDYGMSDVAYGLLLQHKNPSWLYSVDNGATTIWERWNSYTLEKGIGPRGMNSFNHYAYGCVCAWIWKTAAGIASDPAQPGFKHIIMKPVPDKRLGSIKAEYDSAAGKICSEWKYEGDECVWNFTIPEGATASVTLPGETEAKEYEAGSYSLTIK